MRDAISRKQRLQALEEKVREGSAARIRAIMMLKEIRDDELYKAAGFDTLEAYCKARWEWTPAEIRRMIREAEIRAILPPLPMK